MKKYLKYIPFAVATPVLAEGTTPTYTVPQGVTDALGQAQAAAEGLANAAIPYVAGCALAFVGLVVIWLVVKAVKRGAK